MIPHALLYPLLADTSVDSVVRMMPHALLFSPLVDTSVDSDYIPYLQLVPTKDFMYCQ